MTARYGMFIDRERCIGCHACAVACKTENHPPAGKSFMNVKTLGGAHCDTPAGTYPNVQMRWEPTLCMHCEDAPCIKACPTGALDHGLTDINKSKMGLAVQKAQVRMPNGPLKTVGEHVVTVAPHSDVVAEVTVQVVAQAD